MRRAVAPAIPPSLFRHFAIVTLALTTALAMFADGENREAQAAQVQPAPVEAEQPPVIARRAPSAAAARAPLGWNDDSGVEGSFGQPMERLFGGGDSGIIPEEVRSERGDTAESLASLSKAERELLLRGMGESIRSAALARN